MTRFRDRRQAGRRLARELAAYAGRPDVLVLGLPRGGVPVAGEVAQALDAQLDVCVVRKLGVPGHEELAMGAIASGGAWVLNDGVIESLGIAGRLIQEVADREQVELKRRELAYRGDRPAVEVHGRTVILVDDGIATGSTMRAAVAALKRLGPARLVVAVPTASSDACVAIEPEVDELVCLVEPNPFYAVGVWYDNFSQVDDQEVRDILDRSGTAAVGRPSPGPDRAPEFGERSGP